MYGVETESGHTGSISGKVGQLWDRYQKPLGIFGIALGIASAMVAVKHIMRMRKTGKPEKMPLSHNIVHKTPLHRIDAIREGHEKFMVFRKNAINTVHRYQYFLKVISVVCAVYFLFVNVEYIQ